MNEDQSTRDPEVPGAPEQAVAESAETDEAEQAEQAGQEAQPKRARSRPIWREFGVLIVLAIIIALLIKTFVVQAFFIPSSSMEDTLLIGDKVLVNKLVYHFRPIRAGDIVVFNGAGSWVQAPTPAKASSDPVVRAYDDTLLPLGRAIAGLFGTAPGQTDFIKRVIGVPGDRVACCNAQGDVTVNGVALHERSYLYPGAAPSEIRFNIKVPPGRLWVMGDNRQVSDDSRLHTADPGRGTIPENQVVGRAFMIVWPPSRWRVLPIPATFEQRGIVPASASGPLVGRLAGAAPYAPLAGGFALALPLTWLQRRVRSSRSRSGSRSRRARAR
jgi:signal peptidase I